MNVALNKREIELLTQALDSHEYWQLSDERYRWSGFVLEPGSDDRRVAREIRETEALSAKLGALIGKKDRV